MSIFTTVAQATETYYEYSDGSTMSGSDAAAVATVAGFFVLFGIFVGLIIYAIHAFLLGKIFKKAGVAGWIAWVPFYNNWKLLELGDQKGFWSVLAIVPVVNIVSAVFVVIAMYHIGLKLQKDGWFVIIAIFLPLIWEAWLAFDSSTWQSSPLSPQPSYKAPPTNPV